MLLPYDANEEALSLVERIRMISQHLLVEMPECDVQINEHSIKDLLEHTPEHVFIVRQGIVDGKNTNGQVVTSWEPGDICGVAEGYGLSGLALSCKDDVQIDAIQIDKFLQHVHQGKRHQAIWTSYLLTQLALYKQMVGQLAVDNELPETGFSYFETGDVIIRQGDEAHSVYTLITGSADVFVDGVNVGEILEEELFGTMAMFCNTLRTATVIAREPCTVITVSKEEFNLLVQSRPATVTALVENMARRIHALNERVSQLENAVKDDIEF